MGFGNVSERRSAPPQVGVSVVILALGPHDRAGGPSRLWLPLVRRVRQPFLGAWALPGGDLRADRSLEQSAYAALDSTTSLHPRYLEQLYTFGDPARSHGGLPMVSIVYWALVGHSEATVFGNGNAADIDGDDAKTADNVRWFPEDDLPPLAFDHRAIIEYAMARLRSKVEYSDVATRLLGPTFTLRQLHGVYEALAGQSIDLANFRRKMLASGDLEDTGEKVREGRQRPATIYRYVPHDSGNAGVPAHEGGAASVASKSAVSLDVPDLANSVASSGLLAVPAASETGSALSFVDDALSPLVPSAHG